MAGDRKERLPGIDGRYEFTMRFLSRTLHRVRAAQARLAVLESIATDLARLARELEKVACATDRPDRSAAVREFMDVSDSIYDFCEEVRELVDGPPARILVVKVPVRTPPRPSVN